MARLESASIPQRRMDKGDARKPCSKITKRHFVGIVNLGIDAQFRQNVATPRKCPSRTALFEALQRDMPITCEESLVVEEREGSSV